MLVHFKYIVRIQSTYFNSFSRQVSTATQPYNTYNNNNITTKWGKDVPQEKKLKRVAWFCMTHGIPARKHTFCELYCRLLTDERVHVEPTKRCRFRLCIISPKFIFSERKAPTGSYMFLVNKALCAHEFCLWWTRHTKYSLRNENDKFTQRRWKIRNEEKRQFADRHNKITLWNLMRNRKLFGNGNGNNDTYDTGSVSCGNLLWFRRSELTYCSAMWSPVPALMSDDGNRRTNASTHFHNLYTLSQNIYWATALAVFDYLCTLCSLYLSRTTKCLSK